MGLLSALGGLFQGDEDRAAGNLNGLQRFGIALNENGDSATPIALQQSALQKLAQLRANGQTNPQQELSALASVDPQYAEKAATLQAQNPLAALMQGNGGATGGGGSLANLTGDELLKALPPAIAAQVKGYSEGKLQPSAYLMRSPQGQQIMQLVSQYDPTFDATNYAARAATRKSFTSGQDANNITALNTAMGHAASLKDAYDQLGNTDYSWLNTAKNTVQSALGDTSKQSQMASVQSTAHALSEELAKVFRSTGMAESDVKAWEKQIDTSSTPAQSKAVIGSAMELMNSRLDALGEKYNQGMGTTKKGLELLSPKAQAAYQKITGSPAPETNSSQPANPAAQDPVARAKAAGYTQEEIDAYLAKKKGAK